MVDPPIVCCMCGDVGFPEKLFCCTKCCSRFQHSYCTNYYDESSEPTVCDWCQSEGRSTRHAVHPKKSSGRYSRAANRSDYPGDKIKQSNKEESSDRGKNMGGGAPSPRHAGRRYKLLKDVLC